MSSVFACHVVRYTYIWENATWKVTGPTKAREAYNNQCILGSKKVRWA
jgi:hypothetical protein